MVFGNTDYCFLRDMDLILKQKGHSNKEINWKYSQKRALSLAVVGQNKRLKVFVPFAIFSFQSTAKVSYALMRVPMFFIKEFWDTSCVQGCQLFGSWICPLSIQKCVIFSLNVPVLKSQKPEVTFFYPLYYWPKDAF